MHLKNLVCLKVNTTNAKGRHDLLDLKPFTDYEFQVSSKLHLYKGSWSDWSESLRMQTPEEGTCQKKTPQKQEWGGVGAERKDVGKEDDAKISLE